MRELTNEKNYNCLNYGISLIAPIQTMAESVTQNGTIIELWNRILNRSSMKSLLNRVQ